MKFKTVAEAFNHYRTFTNEQLEKRAQEVSGMIETDPDVDITALNIELTGIKQAKDNNMENEARSAGGFNVITGAAAGGAQKKTFTSDTVVDTPEYRSAFFKQMLGQELNADEKAAFEVATGVAEKRADAFTSSTDAVAVLPTETLNEVVKKARTIGGLMGECRAFNVPTKIAIPVGTPGTKATWHTEGAEVESEKNVPTSVTFDGYEIIKIFSISAKVRKMSIAAFEAYLTDELTACVMECIADALINGTGVEQGTGLESITWTKGTNAVEIAKTSDVAYKDVINLVAMLKRGYAQGAKFAMNNSTLYKTFYNIYDSNNRPIFLSEQIASQGNSESVGKILGFDVIIDDNIKDGDVYLGNFSKYLGYNMPEGIVVEASTQSSFKKGLIDYRALAIADCKPIVGEAFVKMYKATA